ncbi:PQQ-dependent sugar dehydrogenase [Streptomyces sp. T028]|uniref:PQQ-dependent sugar dehydrogenase n=1 Tax=Streptomyces sp. T028 TaxID=3394379 RepID=UPI003A87A2CC
MTPDRRVVATLLAALLALCGAQPASVAADPGAPGRAGAAPTAVSVLSEQWTRPWAITFLPDGQKALVTERHSARVWTVARDGSRTKVGEVPNTVFAPAGGDNGNGGGLLGVAPSPTWNGTTDQDVFFVHTAADETRVVRMRFDGTSLSDYQVLLGGIARGGDHNGGKIAFGPDGYLYVSTGDARDKPLAQDPASLNGKILRLTRSGEAAPGNPFGTRVYSLGHRNPQGFAWDARGRLWETEIGDATWDEVNLISPGANYGWPTCEGSCTTAGMTNPLHVWRPSEGGVPAHVAIAHDVLYVATLRGERLWTLPIDGTGTGLGTAVSYYAGVYGRMRALAKVPDADELWLGTSDRGTDKDSLLRVTIG